MDECRRLLKVRLVTGDRCGDVAVAVMEKQLSRTPFLLGRLIPPFPIQHTHTDRPTDRQTGTLEHAHVVVVVVVVAAVLYMRRVN